MPARCFHSQDMAKHRDLALQMIYEIGCTHFGRSDVFEAKADIYILRFSSIRFDANLTENVRHYLLVAF